MTAGPIDTGMGEKDLKHATPSNHADLHLTHASGAQSWGRTMVRWLTEPFS